MILGRTPEGVEREPTHGLTEGNNSRNLAGIRAVGYLAFVAALGALSAAASIPADERPIRRARPSVVVVQYRGPFGWVPTTLLGTE